jgi:hypothetical protein
MPKADRKIAALRSSSEKSEIIDIAQLGIAAPRVYRLCRSGVRGARLSVLRQKREISEVQR